MDDDAHPLVRRLRGDARILGHCHSCIVVDRRNRWDTAHMFSLRPPGPDDAAAVLRVLRARDMADFGAPDFTLEDLLDQWRADEFDVASDAVLAVDAEGVVIGYATLRRSGPGALAVVDPGREGEGVGTALLAWSEQRARDAGEAVHRQWTAAPNTRAHELLERAGYRQVRSYWRMGRKLEPGLSRPREPPGLRISPVALDADARALHAAYEAAFAANADHTPEEFGVFRAHHLAAHDFDPELSNVARREGRIVGFVLCRRWRDEGVGFVDLLGVDPSEHGRGLGSMLLRRTFAAFAEVGLHEAQLGVASDNPAALALYERVGMAVRHRADVFEKAV
jgi:mycothiol synthase